MFSPYRDVLGTPGAARFSAAALLGRANISMDGLALVFLVQHETGSYAKAGAVAGVFGVAVAVGAPVVARRADRVGQRTVIRTVAPVRALATALLVVALLAHAPIAVPLLLAVPAGAATAQVGSMVRTRWTHALRDTPDRVRTAFAWESVLDEIVFISGPLLVTLLATRVTPVAAVAVAVVSSMLGLLWFTSLRATEPPTSRAEPGRTGGMLRERGVLASIATFFAFGALFGSVEVITVAFTAERGHAGAAGALLALFSAASLMAGVVFGVRPWPGSPAQHFAVSTTALAVGMAILPFAGSLGSLALVLGASGLAISPALVSGTQLMQSMAPQGRTTEALTWTGTGVVLGAAGGSALAGHVIEASGASAAYWITAICAVAAALLAVATLIRPSTIPHLRPAP